MHQKERANKKSKTRIYAKQKRAIDEITNSFWGSGSVVSQNCLVAPDSGFVGLFSLPSQKKKQTKTKLLSPK